MRGRRIPRDPETLAALALAALAAARVLFLALAFPFYTNGAAPAAGPAPSRTPGVRRVPKHK
jgi:hypothetical protein